MDERLLEIAEAMQGGEGINPLWGLAAILGLFLIWRVYLFEMKLERRKFEEELRDIEKLFQEKSATIAARKGLAASQAGQKPKPPRNK